MGIDRKPLLSRRLLSFMATMFLANVAYFMILPLEALYIQDLGANVGQVSVFFTLSAIAPLVFQIIGGWLSDAIGRLQAVAIGSVGGALAYLIYIFAPSWGWVLPASVLTAMATAFVWPSFQAFVAEESTEETRGRVYGVTNTIVMVVAIIGPLIGSAVAQGRDYKTIFLIAGSLYAAAAFIRVVMAIHAGKRKIATPEVAKSASFSGLQSSLVSVFGLVVAGGIVTWIFVSDGILDITFKLTDRLIPLYLELVFLNSSLFWHTLVSRALVGIGWALITPAYSALISKAVPLALRGTAYGLFSTSYGFVSFLAPWIGAWLWEAVSPKFPFLVLLLSTLAMLPLAWLKLRLPRETASIAGKQGAMAPPQRQERGPLEISPPFSLIRH